MLPRPILLGLACVPAALRLGLLKEALGEGAAATPRAQACLGGAVGALSRVYEQAPSLLRRLTHHAVRGLWPAATGQTRRPAQSAITRPRSVWRTCPCGH